ncbi:cell death-inducing p53-target protein 1-like [Antrostomus carolinensis]|uniref:cell death-inducing p53-target protein 1-like n=1 Tax=Antrostomus carolinensis TaxID=279965 RepID=UPI0005288CF9|nr:cell death-inducing p53-target protein 1-like [Antrostomus carolinensis]
MASEKGRVEIPMIMYEPHHEPYMQEPSAPAYCSQEGGYEYPSPPPYSCRETTTIEQPVYLVSQPPIIVAGIFSSKPTSTICPSCRQHITTQVTYRLGKLSYLLCTTLCMVGCCFGCCFVPLFIRIFKDADHYCPCCQFHIYRYKRL